MDLVLVSEILPNYKQDRERWAVHRCDLHPNGKANALLARSLKDSALGGQCGSVADFTKETSPTASGVPCFVKGTNAKFANLPQNERSEVSLENPQSSHSHTANPRILEDKQAGRENADSLESTFQQSPTTQKVKSGF